MRIIDSNSLGNTASQQTGRTADVQQGQSSSKNRAAGSTASSDTVELSGQSYRIAATLRADSAARAQRVQQLSAAVQSGSYRVDSAAVSRGLVNEAMMGGD
jgi:flagellar biosynthesis anti-sigma factor FlgM